MRRRILHLVVAGPALWVLGSEAGPYLGTLIGLLVVWLRLLRYLIISPFKRNP